MAEVDKAGVNAALKSVQTRKSRYALFKVLSTTDKISIVLDKQSERDVTYKQLLKDLKDSQPRYVVYDYEFKTADGRATSALYFIYWIPQNSNQNERILYSSGKSNFVSLLTGYKHFSFEEKDEVEEELKNEIVQK